ncbi:hypothetical protein F4823DRAFT_609457 [Ustulina deusta]|nr:hypothetical protein F4823DRAFT_609457 [Ustulina deusta]
MRMEYCLHIIALCMCLGRVHYLYTAKLVRHLAVDLIEELKTRSECGSSVKELPISAWMGLVTYSTIGNPQETSGVVPPRYLQYDEPGGESEQLNTHQPVGTWPAPASRLRVERNFAPVPTPKWFEKWRLSPGGRTLRHAPSMCNGGTANQGTGVVRINRLMLKLTAPTSCDAVLPALLWQ